jgi:hypothetical protein
LILLDKLKRKIHDATRREQHQTQDKKHSTLRYLQDIESERLLLDSNCLPENNGQQIIVLRKVSTRQKGDQRSCLEDKKHTISWPVMGNNIQPLPPTDKVRRHSTLRYLQDKELTTMLLLMGSNFLHQQNAQQIKWVRTFRGRIHE